LQWPNDNNDGGDSQAGGDGPAGNRLAIVPQNRGIHNEVCKALPAQAIVPVATEHRRAEPQPKPQSTRRTDKPLSLCDGAGPLFKVLDTANSCITGVMIGRHSSVVTQHEVCQPISAQRAYV